MQHLLLSSSRIHTRLYQVDCASHLRRLTASTTSSSTRIFCSAPHRFLHTNCTMSAASSTISSSSVKTPSTINLQELLSVCYDLADHAGESIRRIFDSGNLGAIDKASEQERASNNNTSAALTDPQTLADLESQRIIIGNLLRLYGNDLSIVGEEGELDGCKGDGGLFREARKDLFLNEKFLEEYKSLQTSDISLWIDPLDGTKEFTLGYVQYVTVLIGISYKQKALAGVVHTPFIGGKYVWKEDALNAEKKSGSATTMRKHQEKPGSTVWGGVGLGVHGMDVVDLATIPAERKIVTTTRTHFSATLQAQLETLNPDAVVRCGGAGSKGLLVLSGAVDAYVYPQTGTKRWDVCAIDALTKALGGKFTDAYGEEIVYDTKLAHENKDGILSTLRNHERYLLNKDDVKQKAQL